LRTKFTVFSLTMAASFLNIEGSYNPGTSNRSIYHFKLLIALPAEWLTFRR